MKFKTFILTFLMMMSCSISFGQGSLTGSATTEAQLWMHLNDDEIGTISLANDIKITATCPIPNGKKVTIDLNGRKLFTEEEIYIINNEGKLTITDNSEGKTGTISSTLGIYNGVTPTRTSVTDVKYDRVLTINGGVFNSSSENGNAATIYNYRGVIKINGGEFYGEHSAITNYGMATIANAYIECLNRDNGAAAIINDYEIAYGENVNIVGGYTEVTETAYTTGTEPTYLFAELKNGPKYPSLQAALDACTTGDNTINLLFHNSDNATVSQKEGVNITIVGNGYKNKQFEYTGTIYVNGNNRYTGNETLTIQNVNFTTNEADHDFISANVAKEYAHNLTVKDCDFTATGAGEYTAVAMRFRQAYNIKVEGGSFTKLHSVMWATGGGGNGITVEGIVAEFCKNGVSFGTSTPVAVKNSTIDAEIYAVRADGSGAYNLTVANSTLEAEVPVIVRNTTGEEYNLTVAEDVTLTATNGGPQVVVTADSDDVPYVAPTVKVNVTLNNGASTFGLVAKIGNKYYSTLDEAFAVATEGQTITLLGDATPDLTSQSAITKAAVIDLGGKTLTLTEDDLYFGTTEFKNGNIIVDPSVKPSTAVFWMFANQTLTFDNVNITATDVTGTYLIGINGGTGSNVNLLNGTNIIINNESQAGLSAVICDNGTGNNVIIKDSYINVNKIEGRFYLGGTSGNIRVDNTDIDLNGVKEGFYLRANQTLSIEGESEVEVVLNDTNNRYGINITDYSATYTKDDLATVNATVYDPVVRVKNLTELQTALVENVDKPIFATEIIVISEGTLELDLNTRRVFAADKNVIRNDGATLTIKNGTIERVGDVVGYAFNNAQGALNITGTTIKGGLYTSGTSLVATNANISHFQSSRHAIYAYDCNVTLNGGTYHNDNSGNATIMAAGSSVVTIKDGTFSIKDGRQELTWTSCLIDTQNTASITVEGGTFNGGFRVKLGTTMTIEGGSFNDCYGSGYNIFGTAVVKGGTFTDANAINFAKDNLAEGYVASDNGNGTFTVLKGVSKIGDTYYATLQEAIDAAEDGTTTINILADITGDVTILQQEGINIVIDGKKNDTENYTFNGIINIYGNARHTGTETLTIQNIDFYTEVSNTNAYYFINALENGSVTVGNTTYNKQYAHNVTVKGCNFTTSEEDTDNQIVGIGLRQTYNIVVDNCTAKHIFSLMWGTAVDGLELNQVTLEYATEGITLAGASKGVEIKNSKIVSPSYGIRADGPGSDFTIENSTLEAKVPVVVRKVNENSNPSFTFKGTNTITESNPTSYWFVAGAGDAYQGNENEPLPETAGQVSVTLNDTGLNREGIYGSALNGEGTEEKPYLIETVNDLVFFRDQVNGGNNYAGKHVQLAADIDLKNKEWTPIGNVIYDSKYKPADASKVFSGVFDGNDKVISNLKIEKIIGDDPDPDPDAQANVGLFGITGEGAVIKNLTLTNVDIKTSGRNVGALAGFAYKATLDNITVNGDIKIEGGHNVSGVAGMTRYYDMSATNIKVVGNDGSTIVGNNIVGGIFAEIAPNGSTQTFKNLSVENVAITGVGGVGGIVGLLTLGTVEDVTVKNVALTGNTLYKENPMGRIRLGSVAGLMGGKYATIANVITENVTAKNLDGNAVVLPIIGANFDASSNATEARIGDTYYATLQTAINAVQDGETVTLVNDITYTDYVYASGKTTAVNIANGKNFTLNLNGKSITGTNATENNYELVTIAKGTKLTIEDSSADKTGKISYTGTRETNDGWIHRCHTIFNQGTLVLNGGTIENNTPATAEAVASAIDNNASWGNEGYLTVNGGTVISTSYYAVRTDVNTHNTTTNGTMVAKVELNGGTIYGYYLMDRGNDLSKLNDIDFTVNENAVIEACEYNGQALRFRVNAKSEYEIVISDEAIINGTVKGLAANIGNSYFATLQDAVDNVKEGNNTITLLADVTEDVTIIQKEGVNVVIDGAKDAENKYTFTGLMSVDGNARQNGAETLTIKNINFVAKEGANACITAAKGSANYCYSHNLTVENCTFTDPDGVVDCAAIRQPSGIGGGCVNWTVKLCSVDETMHSLMNTSNINNLVVEDCIIVKSKSGLNLNNSNNVTLKGNNFDVQTYALRAGENGGTPAANKYVLIDNTMKSECDGGDAVIIFRNTASAADFSMTQTVVSGTIHISGHTAATQLAIDANYWDGEANPLADPAIRVNSYYADAELQNLVHNYHGDNFIGYTDEFKIWGEVWGNAFESFVIKVLDKNGEVMGTTSLNDVDGFIDGDVTATWSLLFDVASNSDPYWTMSWTSRPTVANMPASVELYVDGHKVGEGPVQLNNPDNLEKKTVAIVDNDGYIKVFYASFDQAYKASKKGDVLELLETAVITKTSSWVNYSTKQITVNARNINPAFRVQDNAYVWFGGMTINSYDGYCIIVGAEDASSGADVEIYGGTYNGETSAISVTKGNLNIVDGTFQVEPYEGSYEYTINCIDANYNNNTAEVSINGGKFYNFNPQDNAAEGIGTNFLTGNYAAVVDADGWYTVGKAYAQIDNKYYATLQDAINAATDGQTVKLTRDITEDVNISKLEKSITIDGDDYDNKYKKMKGLSIGSDDNKLDAGVVTIKNIAFNGKGLSVKELANVTIQDNTFTDITEGNAITVICDNLTEKVNVSANTITNVEAGTGIRIRNAKEAAVTGNKVSEIFNNAILLEGNTTGDIAVTDNVLSNWGKDTEGMGRAIRIVKGENTTATITDNAMIHANAPEEFVKISGNTENVNVNENYWNGQNPFAEELFTDDNNYNAYPQSYYAKYDAATNELSELVTISYVAKIGKVQYTTLAEAATAAQDGETIQLLWNEGDAAISMAASFYGKNVTITGTAKVDWSKNWFFVGRGGEGNATVTFDGANLTSAPTNENNGYGIHVSGREKDTDNKYDGTLVIKNGSNIQLDYLIDRGTITIDNATLTVKNGFGIAGRPASETVDNDPATATISLENGAKLIVNNHNGMGVGQASQDPEGYGIMNIDATSTFETTQSFLVTDNGTMKVNGGNVKVAGNLTNKGTMVVAAESNVEVTGDLNVNGTLNSAGNITGAIVKAATATIQLTGGIYTTEPQDGWCAENYGAFPYDENSWVVREIKGEQTFELTAGWNWVSSYITEFNNNGLAMLQVGLGTNGIQIKNNLKSSTYSNQTGQWNGSLTTTSVNEMYKVKVGELEEGMESLQFNFEGSYVNYDECEIILYPGWNYIGYPVNVETNVADALVLLSADGQEEFNGPSVGDVLKSQQGAAIYFGIDNKPWMFDNQFNLIPGEGYMYHNTSGAVKILRYTTKNSSATTETNNRSSKYWTVDATQYSSNMTMIAMTDVEGDNYEVAAFVNGEVRGSSCPVYVESLDAYILILTISGDDVEEMTFRYYDITTGEEVEFSNRINYSSDAVVGSIAEPYMLTRGTTGIGEAEMSQVNIYPNPTTTGTEINLQATCDKVEVFNALGAKVAEYQNVDTIDALETAGIYVIRITNDSNVQNCKLVVR